MKSCAPPPGTLIKEENQDLEKLPFKVKSKNEYTTVQVAGNRLKKLPKRITKVVTICLARNKYVEIPKEMRKRLKSYKFLKELDLSENNLTAWPKELMAMKPLKTLVLARNKLQQIDISSPTLEILDATQNCLIRSPVLPQVRHMFLDCNKIVEWDLSSEKLELLGLGINSLTSISDKVRLPNLQQLELGRNMLESLPDMAICAPKLTVINCLDNFLTMVPRFPSILKKLSLKRNKLTSLPNFAEMCPQMQILDVSENELTEIPPLPDALEALFCSKNKISKVWNGPLPKLQRAEMDFNCLREASAYSGNSMQEFSYTYNRITTLKLSTFPRSMQKLNLIGNNLTEVPPELFTDFPNLISLTLAKNNITEIPDVWSQCSSLLYVNISNNPIGKLPNNFPPSMKQFVVGFCGLKEIPEGLAQCEALEEFVAPVNNLTSLPLLKNCHTFYLARNKFTQIPMIPDSVRILDLSYNSIFMLPDPMVFMELEDLNLSHNDIDDFPSSTRMPALKTLKVSHNPRIQLTIKPRDFEKLEILNVEGTKMCYTRRPNVREFMTNQENFFVNASVKLIVSSANISYSEMCGIRERMEDAIVIRDNIANNISLYAILDGHGGFLTSTTAAYQFAQFAIDHIEMSPNFIEDAFLVVEDEISRQHYKDGCTATIVMRCGNHLISGHVGDSRMVIVRNDGSIRFATVDHKPYYRREYEKIREIGGRVIQDRVDGLAVSRAIGDPIVVGVLHRPEINEIELEYTDKWIIIACDGVWDVVFDEDIRKLCVTTNNPVDLAADIKNLAYCSASTDNISVICINLQQ